MPRKPTIFTATLYAYVKPENDKFAREYGKKEYGSYSAYVDHLIQKDRKLQRSKRWYHANKKAA